MRSHTTQSGPLQVAASRVIAALRPIASSSQPTGLPGT